MSAGTHHSVCLKPRSGPLVLASRDGPWHTSYLRPLYAPHYWSGRDAQNVDLLCSLCACRSCRLGRSHAAEAWVTSRVHAYARLRLWGDARSPPLPSLRRATTRGDACLALINRNACQGINKTAALRGSAGTLERACRLATVRSPTSAWEPTRI